MSTHQPHVCPPPNLGVTKQIAFGAGLEITQTAPSPVKRRWVTETRRLDARRRRVETRSCSFLS